jgi:hypothetical protein
MLLTAAGGWTANLADLHRAPVHGGGATKFREFAKYRAQPLLSGLVVGIVRIAQALLRHEDRAPAKTRSRMVSVLLLQEARAGAHPSREAAFDTLTRPCFQ